MCNYDIYKIVFEIVKKSCQHRHNFIKVTKTLVFFELDS